MILVTGATGYVGRRIVQRLVEDGESVRCLVRSTSDRKIVESLGVETCAGDVTDLSSLRPACEGIESVVHTVAIIREKGKATFDAVNHLGTKNVVEASSEAGVGRMVHLSAIGAGPDTRYPYLNSKWRAEQAVKESGLTNVILRFSIIFGPGDEFINALAAAVKLGPVTPIIGSGKTAFQPIHVEDAAKCVALALKNEKLIGQALEVGGPDRLSYREIVDLIIRSLGARRIKIRVPISVMKLVAPLLGRMVPHPPITPTQLAMIGLDNVAEPDSVERHFGFTPRPLEGNIGYILNIGWWESVVISLGFRPARRW